jgi:regulator of sigma E protease
VAAGWGDQDLETTRIAGAQIELLPAGAAALAEIPAGATIDRVGSRTVETWGQLEAALLDSPDGAVTLAYSTPNGEVVLSLAGLEEKAQAFAALDFWTEPVVRSVNGGSPADRSGVRAGDRILAVDGVGIVSWPQLVAAVRASPEQEIELTLERDGGMLVRGVVPASARDIDPATGEEQTIGQIGILGTLPAFSYARLPMGEALRAGWSDTLLVSGEILRFLRDLVTGRMSARNLGSIVTIGEMSGQAAAEGLPVFLRFMALFSVNLAILNLLPIPVLDGGHLVFLTIEAVRGRPLSVQQRLRWSQVGFAVLVGIMVLALGNDLLRLFGL